MSFKNLLDLRKKEVQIIERLVFIKRPWHNEAAKIFLTILVASGVIWGVSHADSLANPNATPAVNKNFSAIGIVSGVSSTTISIEDAKGSDGSGNTHYSFETSHINKIETQNYISLSLTDISLGDKIVAQGILTDNNNIAIRRIISFGGGTIAPNVTAASTATTTDETSTPSTSDTATTISDVTASSTAQSSLQEFLIATDTASTTDTSPSAATTTILDTIINTATDTIQNVVDAITGGTSETPDSTSTIDSTGTSDASSTTTDSTLPSSAPQEPLSTSTPVN